MNTSIAEIVLYPGTSQELKIVLRQIDEETFNVFIDGGILSTGEDSFTTSNVYTALDVLHTEAAIAIQEVRLG